MLDRVVDGVIKAFGEQLTGINNRLVLRFREDERRLDAIEARLAAMEAMRDGR